MNTVSYPTTAAFYVALANHNQYKPDDFEWHKVIVSGYTDDKRKKREKDVVLLTLETTDFIHKFPLFAWVKKDCIDSDAIALYRISATNR
jgi:hypothetical protein